MGGGREGPGGGGGGGGEGVMRRGGEGGGGGKQGSVRGANDVSFSVRSLVVEGQGPAAMDWATTGSQEGGGAPDLE